MTHPTSERMVSGAYTYFFLRLAGYTLAEAKYDGPTLLAVISAPYVDGSAFVAECNRRMIKPKPACVQTKFPPCCDNERRGWSGGCLNCGDPAL